MNIEEVRIGNSIRKILTNEYVSIDLQILFKISVNDFSVYEPIEVTEESLLRFGFYKVNSYVFSQNAFIVCRMSLPNGKFTLIYKDLKFPIKYIHGLQNIVFYLTNQELVEG